MSDDSSNDNTQAQLSPERIEFNHAMEAFSQVSTAQMQAQGADVSGLILVQILAAHLTAIIEQFETDDDLEPFMRRAELRAAKILQERAAEIKIAMRNAARQIVVANGVHQALHPKNGRTS